MSSDYISRLRSELLRAGATEPVRVRPARTLRRLRPLALAGAAALLVVALVFTVARPDRDDRAVPPTATARLSEPVAPGAAELAAKTLRARLAAAGISPAFVSHDGNTLQVAVPPNARATATALMAPGRFAVYDWEAGVLGPDGRPAPDDPAVTGGPSAGTANALTQREAQERADRAENGRVLEAENGPGRFAFAGAPALTNASLASARPGVDPLTKDPIVVLTFTEQGRRDFQELTRTIAQRGADLALGGDPLPTSHHLAMVVDDRIVNMPFINWREAPDGIDGAQGAQIVVRTADEARVLAAILESGPLPGS